MLKSPFLFLASSSSNIAAAAAFVQNRRVPRGLVRSAPDFLNKSIRSVSSKAMAIESEAASSVVVYVTVPNKETGTKLATSIVTNKLAACVNQIPGIESTYWWEGKVETDSEVLLVIKTKTDLLEELTTHVKQNHPYSVPEVIALPIQGGNPDYLKWIETSTK